jgi:hypothetical protein
MKSLLQHAAVGGAGLALVVTAVPGANAATPEQDPGKRSGGNVYAATNALTGNAIRTFHRANDGTLTLVGDTPTGGTGSGTFEGSGNSVVLGGVGGESAPTNLTGEERLLFATNSGSDSVSVFRVRGDELELVETEATGDHPISVTVSRGCRVRAERVPEQLHGSWRCTDDHRLPARRARKAGADRGVHPPGQRRLAVRLHPGHLQPGLATCWS